MDQVVMGVVTLVRAAKAVAEEAAPGAAPGRAVIKPQTGGQQRGRRFRRPPFFINQFSDDDGQIFGAGQ